MVGEQLSYPDRKEGWSQNMYRSDCLFFCICVSTSVELGDLQHNMEPEFQGWYVREGGQLCHAKSSKTQHQKLNDLHRSFTKRQTPHEDYSVKFLINYSFNVGVN